MINEEIGRGPLAASERVELDRLRAEVARLRAGSDAGAPAPGPDG